MEQLEKTSTPQSSTRFDRYNHSSKGRARSARYRGTEKYRQTRERFLAKHGGERAYGNNSWLERYHRIQEETGCHSDPRDFYPGYCIIKALAEAEIVEI